ncbi:hypothetical protein [Streptomyces sp. NPDC048473]|uniref:hypothetical protein n=1 Tax=unclassified Streptomyces TaxID=2593676 RepID=UPI00371EF7FC
MSYGYPQPGPGAGGFPQPPKKSRTGLIVTLSVVGGVAVLLALGVLIATSVGSNSSSSKSKPPSAEATEGGAPVEGGASDAPTETEPPPVEDAGAEDDVRITGCEVDSVTQWPAADVEIVNHSGARASYIVNVEFVDGDGTRHGEGLASSANLDAGQKSVGKAQGLGKFTGKLTCRVAEVSRFPAS